jgi:uncharacterized membrane protein
LPLEALFELLFKYRPILFERGRLALGVPWPVLVALLALVAVATPTLLRYSRARGKTEPRDRALLVALRVSALGILVFSLCRPVLVLSTAVPQQSFVGILVDDSLSMRIADREGRARSDFVHGAIGDSEGSLLPALEERFKLRYLRFAGSAERVPGTDGLEFAGERTDLAGGLDRARQELASVPLAGLVVVSDGADNVDGPLTEAILALRADGIPVYAIGLGSERFDRDVELSRIETPREVLKGTTFTADVRLTQRGLAGEHVRLFVEDAGRVVHTEELELPAVEELSVRVHATASEPGPRVFTFRVTPLEGEQVAANNRRDVLVRVSDREEKILYFEGEPRFEAKFVRRAVEGDDNIRVVTLLRTSESKFYRVGVDDAEELVDGFPKMREELFRYRGLILGSVEAGFFSGAQLRMIADFVGERGGGLLMLGGRHSFSEGGYARTPVADALPVVLEAAPASADREPQRFFADVKVELTPFGRTQGVTRLGETDAESAERWDGLPPLSIVNAVARSKPGAATLLTGSVAGRASPQIVLAYQRYGGGKGLAFTVQDSWQWQMSADIPLEDRTHEGLWQQLLRWLVSDVPGQVRVTTPEDRVSPGRAVPLRAEVRDDTFLKVNDADVVAVVEDPAGDEREYPMEWSVERDGEYVTRIRTREPGFYAIRVEAGRGDEVLGSTETWVQAVPLDTEHFGAERRTALLKRLAEETGGRFYTPETAADLPEDLTYTESGATIEERKDLWDMPALFLSALALVSAEWGYRKWRGLT